MDHTEVLIQKEHINTHLHKEAMDTAAWRNPDSGAFRQGGFSHEPLQSFQKGIRFLQIFYKHFPRIFSHQLTHCSLSFRRFFAFLFFLIFSSSSSYRNTYSADSKTFPSYSILLVRMFPSKLRIPGWVT